MAREKQGFIFGFKWGKALRNLPTELRHEVQDAIIDYGTDGTIIPMSDAARGIFEFIKIQIDDNNSKYEDVVEKRREAGRRGGAPAGNHNANQKQAKQANGCFDKQNKQNNQKQAKQADYDCDCDCDCDCDKKKKKISATPYGVSDKEKDTTESSVFGGEAVEAPAPPAETPSPTSTPSPAEVWELIKNGPSPEEKPKRKPPFKPPELEEVRAYIAEKGYSVDAEKWWNFYDSKGWMIGKNKMANWRSAVATWQRDNDSRTNGKRNDSHGTETGEYDRRKGVPLRADEVKTYGGTF